MRPRASSFISRRPWGVSCRREQEQEQQQQHINKQQQQINKQRRVGGAGLSYSLSTAPSLSTLTRADR